MFDIGFAELLIVAVVALVVLGPEKLPVAARTLGLWLGRIRRTVSSIQSEISEELRIEEMKRTAAISKEKLDQELNDMRTPFTEALGDESPMSQSAVSPEQKASQSAESSPQSGAASSEPKPGADAPSDRKQNDG